MKFSAWGFWALTVVTGSAGAGDKIVYTHRFDEGGIAERQWNTDVFLMNVNTGASERLTDHHADDRQPAISGDGEWVAFVTDRWSGTRDGEQQVALLNLQTREIKRISGGDEYWTQSPAFSPDGKTVYFSQSQAYTGPTQPQGDYYLMAYDIKSGVTKQITQGEESVVEVAVSPDGESVAYRAMSGAGHMVKILRLNQGGNGEILTKKICDGRLENCKERNVRAFEGLPAWRDSHRVNVVSDEGRREVPFSKNLLEVGLETGLAKQEFISTQFYDFFSVCWLSVDRAVVSARDANNGANQPQIYLLDLRTHPLTPVTGPLIRQLTHKPTEWSADAGCQRQAGE